MVFKIGPYALRLPNTAVFPDPSESPAHGRALPQFRIGPFDVHATLQNGTLQDWRDHVEWTTKYQATILDIEANDIPGLVLAPALSAQRLDYGFQADSRETLSIVAWSDVPTTPRQQQLVNDMVLTIHLYEPTLQSSRQTQPPSM